MCKFHILAHNSPGYLAKCRACGSFKLAFGTTQAVFEPAEPDDLYTQLNTT